MHYYTMHTQTLEDKLEEDLFLSIPFMCIYCLSIYMLNQINNPIHLTIKHMNSALVMDAKHQEINIIHNNLHLALILTNDKHYLYVTDKYQTSRIPAHRPHITQYLHSINKLNRDDYQDLPLLCNSLLSRILNILIKHNLVKFQTNHNSDILLYISFEFQPIDMHSKEHIVNQPKYKIHHFPKYILLLSLIKSIIFQKQLVNNSLHSFHDNWWTSYGIHLLFFLSDLNNS